MPAADEHLRLPEARLRVLRARRLGAVPAPVHDLPAVQLRRHRRAPALGDKDVPSGNIKLAMSHVVPDLVQKVAQGAGPAAHPGRRVTRCAATPTAATSPAASSPRCSTGAPQRGLQPLDARRHHGPRAGRADLAQGPRRREAVPLGLRSPLSARRADADPGAAQGPGGARLRGRRPTSRGARRGDPLGGRGRSRRGGSDLAPAGAASPWRSSGPDPRHVPPSEPSWQQIPRLTLEG